MQPSPAIMPAAPVAGAAVQAAPALGAVALCLLAVCRQHHGRTVGLSELALRARIGRERCTEELQELAAAGLVIYRHEATGALWAPAAPWQPACNGRWYLVRELPTGQPHGYQQQAHPSGAVYACQEQAQAAADQLNHATPVLRLRPADQYAELPEPQYTPHPWDLK